MTHPSNRPQDNLDTIFESHGLTELEQGKVNELRSAAKAFAKVIVECTPSCADQSAALRKVREALMISNLAIALNDEKGLCC